VKRAESKDWLLETAVTEEQPGWRKPHRAWISDPRRFVVGYAVGDTEADAVRAALLDAGSHYRKDMDALVALEAAYFGPGGMLAPSAAADRYRRRQAPPGRSA
jgi:hypothetical protein